MSTSKTSKWKEIKLEGELLADGGGLEGLIGIEELVDYEVVNNKKGKKRKKPLVDSEKKDNIKPMKKAKIANGKLSNQVTQFGFVTEEIVAPVKPTKTFEIINETEKEKDKKQSKQTKVTKPKRTEIGMTKQEEPLQETNAESNNSKALNVEDLQAWNGLGLSNEVLKSLAEQGFKKPTPIQSLTLAAAILGRRDILGAAETGSGKTLAFGLPILHRILEFKENAAKEYSEVKKPDTKTINSDNEDEEEDFSNDDTNVGDFSDDDSEIDDENSVSEDEFEGDSGMECPENENVFNNAVTIKKPTNLKPLYALILTPTRELAIQVKNHLIAAAKYTDIRVAVVVGGMAAVKQERILSKCPEIVVATPGRLWELITQGNTHLSQIDNIRLLAIDETDRMMEKGHFLELQNILERVNSDSENVKARQNFVFSATLTLVHDVPKYLKMKKKRKSKKVAKQTSEQKVQNLIEILGITNPKIVDVTQKKSTAESLTECRIACAFEHKDYYLYYFLQRHPGRTIIFCNSIGCVKRLAQLFGLLGCNPLPLHASMQQRQRLKNLEKFRDNEHAILVATDVAARGLDIPDVQHVIHYQVPRTSENYVHRSGRTARSQKEGIAVLIMEPEEMRNYTRLCKTLGRTQDLPLFPIIDSLLASVKKRVNLARDLDTMELQTRRSQAHNGWRKKAAEDMEMILDSEDDEDNEKERETAIKNKQISSIRKELNSLLRQPLFPKGFCYKYPTRDGQSNIPLVQGDQSTENAVEVMKKAIENYKRSHIPIKKKKSVDNEINPTLAKKIRLSRQTKKTVIQEKQNK